MNKLNIMKYEMKKNEKMIKEIELMFNNYKKYLKIQYLIYIYLKIILIKNIFYE